MAALIHDRDAKYGAEVPAAIRFLNLKALRTSFASPWQNGVAERWVGCCRRDLLDHVIPLNERHLKRLLSEHVEHGVRHAVVVERTAKSKRPFPSILNI